MSQLVVNVGTIICHGGSTPKAVMNMLYRADESVQGQSNIKIREALKTA